MNARWESCFTVKAILLVRIVAVSFCFKCKIQLFDEFYSNYGKIFDIYTLFIYLLENQV